jgi:RNA polymerase sigma factor (sigma-70 family)
VVTANGGIHGFVKAIAIYAAWRTHRPVEGDDDDLAVALRFTRSTWPTPEARLLARELRQRVRQAIRDLPPQYRRTALLRYVHELSGPAIAERLGVASVTVPGYLHQVRARLRPALADLVTIAPPEGRARGGHLRFG